MSNIEIVPGDCRNSLKLMADNSIDSCVTDPPYSLVSIQKRFGKPGQAPAQYGKDGLYQRASSGFMGASWDTGEVAHDPAFWAEVLRVLKPGAHLLAFCGTRTYHRMACAIEDAGFEIRDQIAWMYGTGFPKSHDVSKGIDKAAGAERVSLGIDKARAARIPRADRYVDSPSGWQDRGRCVDITEAATDEAKEWSGWGTALKPAFENIVVARKPLIGTVAENVLTHGTGAINIDGCRIETEGRPLREIDPKPEANGVVYSGRRVAGTGFDGGSKAVGTTDQGRWPANVCHDGSDEVIAAFPDSAGALFATGAKYGGREAKNCYGDYGPRPDQAPRGDSGSAARFFYSAKASKADRAGSKHPTVKPISLMRWLCRLVTPPGGTVLDPFAGSGTTGVACMAEGFNAILCEREEEYLADIKNRIESFQAENETHSVTRKGRKIKERPVEDNLPLFG